MCIENRDWGGRRSIHNRYFFHDLQVILHLPFFRTDTHYAVHLKFTLYNAGKRGLPAQTVNNLYTLRVHKVL